MSTPSLPLLFLLAIFHGIAEFLPISSSTHLHYLEGLLQIQSEALDITLGLGSAAAVLAVFRKQVWKILCGLCKAEKSAWLYAFGAVLACIPATLFYLLIFRRIQATLPSHLWIPGTAFCLLGLFLLSTRWARKEHTPADNRPPLTSCLLMGLVQAIALLPGVSRSGMTISTGRWCRLPYDCVIRFSFLVSVLLAIGDLLLHLDTFRTSTVSLPHLTFCGILAFLLGIPSLLFLLWLCRRGHFWLFGFYSLSLGIFLLCRLFI